MYELIQIVFSRLPEVQNGDDDEGSETDTEDADDDDGNLDFGYGMRCAVDIFHFLCSLLNVVEVVETEGSTVQTADEDVQLFALVLINTAVQLSGDGIGMHLKLLRMMKDDLFHHLVHYGTCSSPLVFSMICSTVLNMYHFLRRLIFLGRYADALSLIFFSHYNLNHDYFFVLQVHSTPIRIVLRICAVQSCSSSRSNNPTSRSCTRSNYKLLQATDIRS